MNASLNFSSLTKKIVMAVAGLFLMTFLVVHLSINLCLLRNDNGEWFNAAAHFMGTNYIIKVFEVFLFGGLIIHIIFGIILQIKNWISRPVGYKVSNKSTTSFLSKYMIYTGGIIFIFLFIHFMNFYFMKMGWVEKTFTMNGDEPDFYLVAKALFASNFYSILYIVLICILGFHLNHAFQAAFQSLGLNHPTYTPWIKSFSTIYSLFIVIGFNVIPLYFIFFNA
ncbi:MAG: succinate dehydrogenase cytochrome b subunit [Bacteroidetes bacterium]|nr:succinate dehydrogenase cytochrome b subunit [Bacteroidota bacterium]